MNSRPASASPPCIHDTHGVRWRWRDIVQVSALVRVTGVSRRQIGRLLRNNGIESFRLELTGAETRRPYFSAVTRDDAERFVSWFCQVSPEKAAAAIVRVQACGGPTSL